MPGTWTNEEFRQILTGEHARVRDIPQATCKRIPSSPRCKLCNAPFGGAGGAVMKHLGFGRFPGQPGHLPELHQPVPQDRASAGRRSRSRCSSRTSAGRRRSASGSARPTSTTSSRTSTGSARRRSSTTAGIVDKLVGDEVIGLFFGGVSGPRHAAAAIEAATDLVARAGRADATPMGPIPIGAGGPHRDRVSSARPGRRGSSTTSRRSATPSTRRPAWRPRPRPASCSSARTRPRRRARSRPTRSAGRSTCAGGRRRSTSSSFARRADGRLAQVADRRAPPLEQDDVAPAARSRPGPADAGRRRAGSRPARGARGSRRCRP